MKNKFLYWLLPLIWMGVIFYSSSTPYDQQDIKPLLGEFIDLSFLEPYVSWIFFTYNNAPVSVETHGVDGLLEFFIRKGTHVFVFFLLTSLIYLALRKTTALIFKTKLGLSFLLTVAYAIVDEIHQGFTPNRTPYLGDVILDSLGGLLAILMIFLIRKKAELKTPQT